MMGVHSPAMMYRYNPHRYTDMAIAKFMHSVGLHTNWMHYIIQHFKCFKFV